MLLAFPRNSRSVFSLFRKTVSTPRLMAHLRSLFARRSAYEDLSNQRLPRRPRHTRETRQVDQNQPMTSRPHRRTIPLATNWQRRDGLADCGVIRRVRLWPVESVNQGSLIDTVNVVLSLALATTAACSNVGGPRSPMAPFENANGSSGMPKRLRFSSPSALIS